MRLKHIYIILVGLLFYACDGQTKKNICTSDIAIKKISQLPEIVKQGKYIDSLTNHKHGVSFMVEDDLVGKKKYFRIKTGYNGNLRWETSYIFYADKENCSIYYFDTVSEKLLTIEQWRYSFNKQQNKMTTIEFNNLFTDGTVIEFTPNDLGKNTPEIKEFKEKLSLFESQHPLPDDFDSQNLKTLINNETFVNNERFVNSSWLEYFISKYKIDFNLLYDLMDLAIEQEDYNAVKIIIDKGSIVSRKEIDSAELSLNYYESLKGKIDVEEFYDPKFSQISKIVPYIRNSFSKNHIQDPDGYTNLRKEKNTSSEILQKIKSGDHIEVLDNSGDWFLIKTKEGKQGYVHKSRIKSN